MPEDIMPSERLAGLEVARDMVAEALENSRSAAAEGCGIHTDAILVWQGLLDGMDIALANVAAAIKIVEDKFVPSLTNQALKVMTQMGKCPDTCSLAQTAKQELARRKEQNGFYQE